MLYVLYSLRPPIREGDENFPPILTKLIRRCWHKDPSQRPSMRAFCRCDDNIMIMIITIMIMIMIIMIITIMIVMIVIIRIMNNE